MKKRLAAANSKKPQTELMSKFFIFSATMSKFIIFSVVFFLLILAASGSAFILSMRQIVRTNSGNELSQTLEIEKLKLEFFVNSEISIAMKMADSPLIKRYFAFPYSLELRNMAFEELQAYRRVFKSNSVFWVNDIDRIFYSDDYEPYLIDPENPDNYWYNLTLYETESYNFNINYNSEFNITNLWINAPVFDDNRNPLGIVGTGIEISEFINTVYRDYSGRAELFYFNGTGEITGAKDVKLVESKKKINGELIDSGINIMSYAKNLYPGEVMTLDSSIGKVAIGTLPLLEWYSIAILPDRIGDYNSVMTVLFFSMLMVVALVFIIFNLVISGLLKPLRKSMEDAEISSRAKTAFLANMSHEIRTPMNSIVGFSELAIDGETSPKTIDYLGKIQTNAEWLLQIINDILDISKIESGKMELEKIPFDMHELFSSCRTLIMPKAVEKCVQLHFYVEPSMGKMPLGDPTRLRQVLINLLSNAVKFTKAGIVKLQAAIIGKTDKTITMHFEVKDSGIGMTEEQIEKIFNPFTQAESGTTRKYGGTGLGLAITKSIIEMMGGKLDVESTLKVGSKFSFDLAFETTDVPENIRLDRASTLEEIEKPVFDGEILLCEDNNMNQQVICEHLSRVGIKTVVADNGKIGLDMVRGRALSGDKQFDLIFMDMHMPVMDGLEASAKILELNTGVPVVAMTANIMSNDLEIYRSSGMNDCVGKPFTSQELWRCLLKYLKPVSGGNVIKKNPNKDIQWSWTTPTEGDQFNLDAEFRRSLVKTFLRNNRTKYDEITDALKIGDIKLAHRLAHSLKGNAGQLGQINLQKAAGDIENQLKDGQNLVTQKQLAFLDSALNEAFFDLDAQVAQFEGRATVNPKEMLDEEKAKELLGKLEELLKRGNPECQALLNDLRAIPESGPLAQLIEDFEFDEALLKVGELKKELFNNE